MKSNQFWARNGPFAQDDFFFRKTIKQNLIYILAPFIMQNFKTNP